MKRIFTFLLAISISILCCGCTTPPPQDSSFDNYHDFFNPTHYTDVYPPLWQLNDFVVETAINTDHKEIVEQHANSTNASERFLNLHHSAAQYYIFPILSPYLENTALIAIVYSSQEQLTSDSLLGIETLALTASPNTMHTSEMYYELRDISPLLTDPSTLKQFLNENSNTTIQGIVYNAWGIAIAYINPESGYLNLYGGSPTPRYIAPVKSVEDGRAAYEVFRNRAADICTELPIYEWKASLQLSGFLRLYIHTGNNVGSYMFESDFNIPVPLVTADGQEGCMVLYLIFAEGSFVGEIIIERKANRTNTAFADAEFVCIWERAAAIDPKTDKYQALEYSKYIEDLKSLNNDFESTSFIKGITFKDGDFQPVY